MSLRRNLLALVFILGVAVPAQAQFALLEDVTPVQTTSGSTCTQNITLATGSLVTVTTASRESLSVTTVIGTLNGSYTLMVANAPGNRTSSIYYFISSGAGAETITVQFSGTITTGAICAVQEWSHTGTVTANLVNVNSADNATVTTHPHGSITTAATAGLILTVAAESASATETPGAGFTALADGTFRYYAQYDITSVASVTTDGAFTTAAGISTEGSIGSFNDSTIGAGGSSGGCRQMPLLGVGGTCAD